MIMIGYLIFFRVEEHMIHVTGESNIVPCKEKDDPQKALGWMIKIDRKSAAQFKVLHEKALALSTAIILPLHTTVTILRALATSITRPPSSLTEGRSYVTDGVRLAQRPTRGASRRWK
jgi:hypothetical protein